MRSIRSHYDRRRLETGRDTPDYVDGLVGVVALKHQDAWPLCVTRIILNDHSSVQPPDDIVHLQIVCRKLFVPVQRDLNVAASDELPYFS